MCNSENSDFMMKCFEEYSAELDSKHNKYERLVKLSRDITIESKRIIFLLHSLSKGKKKENTYKNAEKRLSDLCANQFQSIAMELHGEDQNQFSRAFTAGVQEYIEAYSFYYFLNCGRLSNWCDIQKQYCYSVVDCDTEAAIPASDERTLDLPLADYLLGIADLTGELMRLCINSIGSGQIESSHCVCSFVRYIHDASLGLPKFGNREWSKKLFVLRQSLLKIESACYMVHVRGSEVPQCMIADAINWTAPAPHEAMLDEHDNYY